MEERLRRVRVSTGLSMAKFAEKIGIKAASISRLESGVNSPADRTVKLICSEFGVSETWLRTGDGEMYEKKPAADDLLGRLATDFKMSETEIAFLEAYLQLPAEKRMVLEELIDKACDIRSRKIGEAKRAFVDDLLAEATPVEHPQAGNE